MRRTSVIATLAAAAMLFLTLAVSTTAGAEDAQDISSDSRDSSDQASHDDDAPTQVAVDPQTGEILGPAPDDWVERRWALDLNIDGGLSRRDEQLGFLGRPRAGITRIEGPYAISLGATTEVGTETSTAFGLELDMLSLHLGLFGHLGGAVDLDGNPVATVGGGWQIIGIEGQYRTTPDDPDTYGWTGVMKLRVPVSWLIRAARH